MKIYKTCRELMIFNFYEILETKDYRYLIKGYEDIEITDKEVKELGLYEIWVKIFKEYIDLKDDKTIRLSFKKKYQIAKLETKRTFGANLLRLLLIQTEDIKIDETIEQLNAWGFKIKKRTNEEIELVLRQLKSLKSSITIKKVAYEKEFNKEQKNEKIDLDRQIYGMEQILDMKYHILKKHTTVKEFATISKMAIEKAKKQKSYGRTG